MTNKKKSSKQSVLPTLNPENGIPLLQRQIERLDGMLKSNTRHDDPTVISWESTTLNILDGIFGKPEGEYHENTKEFKYANGSGITLINMSDYQLQKSFQNDLQSKKALLISYVEYLSDINSINQASEDKSKESPNKTALIHVSKLLSRFHVVARQLRVRHDNRSTLEIEDEYDVQDLLHSLLKLHFDDVRPEENGPSYAGRSPRMDFLLKNESIVIEAKKTRKNLGAKEIGDELLEDIGRYGQHQDCKVLVCFVYDPEGRIGNPSGLVTDLEKKSSQTLKIVVIICP